MVILPFSEGAFVDDFEQMGRNVGEARFGEQGKGWWGNHMVAWKLCILFDGGEKEKKQEGGQAVKVLLFLYTSLLVTEGAYGE